MKNTIKKKKNTQIAKKVSKKSCITMLQIKKKVISKYKNVIVYFLH